MRRPATGSMHYLTNTLLLIVAGFMINGGYCAPEQRDVRLTAGGEATIETPGYPTSSPEVGTSILWSVSSPEGSTITIDCPDVRITESEGCQKGSLIINHSGGKSSRLCGSKTEVRITSNNNHMTVHFELIWASGLVNCKVSASGRPTPTITAGPEGVQKISIMPGDKPYTEIDYRPVPLGKKLVWEFTTDPEYKIAIKCPNLWFTYTGSCDGGSVTIDLGNKKEEICDKANNVQFTSDKNVLTVTLKTVQSTVGFLQCSVLVTNGLNFEPWKNLPWIEENSSEYGLLQKEGPKQTSCNCGWVNKPNRRILNGFEAGPNEFPWMAALLDRGQQFCGGSIITEYHVLTAAHCTVGSDPKNVTVGVGINNREKREHGQEIQAVEFINHKDYVKGYVTKRDIGIVVLAEKIKFNQKVGPVCLPTYEHTTVYNNYGVASGWGGMTPEEYETRNPDLLMKTKLKVINMKLCNMVYDFRYETNPETQLCAWAPKSGVCFGDSGGPLVWLDPDTNRYTLVGVTSLSDWCKFKRPDIFTAVHYYYPWILESIGRSSKAKAQVCTKLQ